MTKKMKKRLRRIIGGGSMFVITLLITTMIPNLSINLVLMLYLATYFIAGGDIVKKAVGNIGNGQIFDENFLMMLATVGAFLIGEYPEAIAVLLFYQVGEFFQNYAVNKSRKSIAELMNIRPDFAWVLRDGEWVKTQPEEVVVGEIILVKPGEKIPLDGDVISGSTSLDTMALTGESIPRDVVEGETVISGCVNITGRIEVKVSKIYGESTVAKILELVENAASKKAETENFISKFARYYTPFVVLGAVLLALIPSLITGEWSVWIYRALTFLVVSCPCALVISIPLSFFGGLGGASKQGILIKGSNYLESLAKTEIVVMDKTGTLTKGCFKVVEIFSNQISDEKLIEIAAYAEYYSNHPISISIQGTYGKEIDKNKIGQVKEIPGFGVCSQIDDEIYYVGNAKLMEQQKIEYTKVKTIGTIVQIAKNNQYLGYIVIADEIKDDAKQAIEKIRGLGIQNIVMLTGDRKEVAEAIAKELGITRVYSELLPGDKVDKVEELLSEKSDKGKLIFVGDGINDAPVLARVDIGIAMGGLGSDAAIEAADVVIMTDEPSKISLAIETSKKTLTIVRQNIIFALGVKALALILASMGIATMWLAIFADVGVSVIAILNAMRTLKVKKDGNL